MKLLAFEREHIIFILLGMTRWNEQVLRKMDDENLMKLYKDECKKARS